MNKNLTSSTLADERPVIGRLLIDAEATIKECGDLLTGDPFQDPVHRRTWQAVNTMQRKGEPLGTIEIVQAAGLEALEAQRLIDGATHIGAVRYHAQRLQNEDLKAQAAKILSNAEGGEGLRFALKKIEELLPSASVQTGYKSLATLAGEPIDEEEILIGNKECRYIERAAICLLSGAAGTGKSHVANQLNVGWAQGLEVFGLTPARPIRCLTIQGENPDNDARCIASNMLKGISKEGLALVHENTLQKWLPSCTGEQFLGELASIARTWRPDMVFIDPLLSFAPGALTDPVVVQSFCRQGLSGLAKDYGCALFITHHTPKPNANRDPSKMGAYDFQYMASGNADLSANWPRSALGLQALQRGEFLLRATKRRPPWKNADGETAWEIGIRHTEGGTWETFDAETVTAGNGHDPAKDAATLAGLAIKQPYKLGDLRECAVETFRAGRGRRAFDYLRENVRSFGLIVSQAKHKGACFIGTKIEAENAALLWDRGAGK
jgi:hypothetical protein